MMIIPASQTLSFIDQIRRVIRPRALKYDGLVRPFGPGVHREIQLELDLRPRPRAQVR